MSQVQFQFQDKHKYQIILNRLIFEKVADFSDTSDADSNSIIKFGERDSIGKYLLKWDLGYGLYYPFYFLNYWLYNSYISPDSFAVIRDLTDGGAVVFSRKISDIFSLVNTALPIVLKLTSPIISGDIYTMSINGNESEYRASTQDFWEPLMAGTEPVCVFPIDYDTIKIYSLSNINPTVEQKEILVYHKDTNIQRIDKKYTNFIIDTRTQYNNHEQYVLEWDKRYNITSIGQYTELYMSTIFDPAIEHEIHLLNDSEEWVVVEVPGKFTQQGLSNFTDIPTNCEAVIKYIGKINNDSAFIYQITDLGR